MKKFIVIFILCLFLLFGCTTKKSNKEEDLEITLNSNDPQSYTTVKLLGNTFRVEKLPSIAAAVAPEVEIRNISSNMEIKLGNKSNLVVSKIGKESQKFKELANKITKLVLE